MHAIRIMPKRTEMADLSIFPHLQEWICIFLFNQSSQIFFAACCSTKYTGHFRAGFIFCVPAAWGVRKGKIKQNRLQNTSLSFLLKSFMNYCAQKSATMKAKHIKAHSSLTILYSVLHNETALCILFASPIVPPMLLSLSQNVLTCHLCSYFLVFLPSSFASCLWEHCQEQELMKQDHFCHFPVVPQQSWRLQ